MVLHRAFTPRRVSVILICSCLAVTSRSWGVHESRVALLNFRNAVIPEKIPASELATEYYDHQYDYLENGLVEMLMTDVAENHTLSLVERVRVDNLSEEIALDASKAIDPATAQKAGMALQADELVSGVILRQDGHLCAKVWIQKVERYDSSTHITCLVQGMDFFMWETAIADGLKTLLGGTPNIPVPIGSLGNGTVAILPFNNNSTDTQKNFLSLAIADVLAANLPVRVPWKIVERNRLSAVLRELHLQDSEMIDAATALRVGKILGAKYLLFGCYIVADKKIRIDARVTEVETGRTLRYWKSFGTEADITKVVENLVQKIKK